ncbi:MAG: hypothetical protein KDC05_04455 [Bacteroidales bacterium]|nr:hypothetical protein [Bacteroidales bacterium]
MNILEFLKILRKNLALLFGIPVVLAFFVFLLTSDSPKTYSSKTKVYTGIASGYSIESQQNASFNYFAINNAFDNLINLITARSTIEETALKLYALHLMQDEPMLPVITQNSLMEVKKITPPEIFKLVDKNSLEKTYNNLLAYKNKDESNHVYKLINLNHRHYSYKAISQVKAKRIANSDMIELTYDSDDPAVCYQVLNLLVHTFIDSYSKLKENQTDQVVQYFEGQLAIAHDKLQNAEGKLLNFNMDNKIINYYEQTKHIASEKEKFELERQTVMLDFAAAESVISNLEESMGARVKLKLQGSNIIKMRSELNLLNEKIALQRFQQTDSTVTTTETIDELAFRAEDLKQKMRNTIDSLHFYENTKEGLRMDDVINNWLQNVIAYEEAAAKLNALKIRRLELEQTIQHFAPLGANLKKIEREIDVVEREYLSLLHSLSLAKLKQQDIELSSNIKIVDPPVLPISPLPSKRKFIIIAAALAGFIGTFAILLLLHFFDTTLQNSNRAEKITGLLSLGNFPALKNSGKSAVSPDHLKSATIKSIFNNLLKYRTGSFQKPMRVAIISHYPGEGKTTLISNFEKYISPESGNHVIADEKNRNVTFEEIPPLIGNILPEQFYTDFDLIGYVLRADRGWDTADKKMLDVVQKIRKDTPIGFILNKVDIDNLGDFIGPVPKKRSGFRKMVKRIALLRFFEKFDFKQG